MRRLLALIGILLFATPAYAQEASGPELPEVMRPKRPEREKPVNFVPLPVWATLPNEGSTYGFMPVFLINDDEAHIKGIIAPSITWNDVTHVTGTARYFQFPNDFEERILQASYATRLFSEVIADWLVAPKEKGRFTRFLSFNYRKDPFRRFYGLGMDSSVTDETSYTLEGSRGIIRYGYNITDNLNLNFMVAGTAYQPENDGVQSLPKTHEKFPKVPGIDGSVTGQFGLGVRFDTRPTREYSTRGALVDLNVIGAHNTINEGDLYSIVKFDSRYLWEELERVNGAARLFWSHSYSSQVPFYEKPSLGGSFLLRGYSLDRFIDNAAWNIDLEQRITAWILNVEGSTVHLRLDPFITFGQVYNDAARMFDRVRFAYGMGVRFFSPPNVIGRIDIAKGGDGLNLFVELGYPF